MLCFGREKHNPCSQAPSLHGLLDSEAEGIMIFERLGNTNPTTQYHIPEGSSLCHHGCENLKSRIKYLPSFSGVLGGSNPSEIPKF